jgi:hypothetical protein
MLPLKCVFLRLSDKHHITKILKQHFICQLNQGFRLVYELLYVDLQKKFEFFSVRVPPFDQNRQKKNFFP